MFASQGPDPIVEVRMLCWKRTNHGFYHEFLGIDHGFTMDFIVNYIPDLSHMNEFFLDIHRFDHDFCGGFKCHLRPEISVA